jgi:hypothetical protein
MDGGAPVTEAGASDAGAPAMDAAASDDGASDAGASDAGASPMDAAASSTSVSYTGDIPATGTKNGTATAMGFSFGAVPTGSTGIQFTYTSDVAISFLAADQAGLYTGGASQLLANQAACPGKSNTTMYGSVPLPAATTPSTQMITWSSLGVDPSTTLFVEWGIIETTTLGAATVNISVSNVSLY